MRTKILLLIIALLFVFTCGYSQVYKNRAKQFAVKSKSDYGGWTKWSDWDDCNLIVVINLDKSTFTIYSKETQEFDIVEHFPKIVDDDGIPVFKMLCIDKDGLRCHIRQRFIKNDYFTSQLYIDYSNLSYVYNLVSN